MAAGPGHPRKRSRQSSARAETPTTKASSPNSGNRSWHGSRRRTPRPSPEWAYLTLDATEWQYTGGEPDETLINPESWHHDFDLLSRPGNDKYSSSFSSTTAPTHRNTRRCTSISVAKPPLLAAWGSGDGIFGPDGARAFARDLPDAEIHLLDGGHFVLESAGDKVAELIRGFWANTSPHDSTIECDAVAGRAHRTLTTPRRELWVAKTRVSGEPVPRMRGQYYRGHDIYRCSRRGGPRRLA